MGVYFPKKSHNGYYDKALNKTFFSKTEKANFLKEHGMHEDSSMESERHRENRLVEQINYEREKKGEKPLTKERIIGDSHEYREWKVR